MLSAAHTIKLRLITRVVENRDVFIWGYVASTSPPLQFLNYYTSCGAIT
jgi:hypothetical protein